MTTPRDPVDRTRPSSRELYLVRGRWWRLATGDELEGRPEGAIRIPGPIVVVLSPVIGGLYAVAFPAVVLLTLVQVARRRGQSLSRDCATCHASLDETHGLVLGDGTTVPARVAPGALDGSVHAEIACVECHPDVGAFPHPERALADLADLARASSRACGRCHSDVARHVVDGIHARRAEWGVREAPSCADCHGGHAVTPPDRPRQTISDRCGGCHPEEAEVYAASVHGEGLEEGDLDHPTCTDCHGAHAIEDPGAGEHRAAGHEVCAHCHADEERMVRHELNPNVVETYLDDFHGMSNRLDLKSGLRAERGFATCSDCHGSHAVERLSRGVDEAERAERVHAMCVSCHEGATAEFAGAFLGHQEMGPRSAPLAWLVALAYRLLIPVILVALVVHILLDLSQARPTKQEREMKS